MSTCDHNFVKCHIYSLDISVLQHPLRERKSDYLNETLGSLAVHYKHIFAETVRICQSKWWHITEEMFNWRHNAKVQQH